jgi:hypothetical protein
VRGIAECMGRRQTKRIEAAGTGLVQDLELANASLVASDVGGKVGVALREISHALRRIVALGRLTQDLVVCLHP